MKTNGATSHSQPLSHGPVPRNVTSLIFSLLLVTAAVPVCYLHPSLAADHLVMLLEMVSLVGRRQEGRMRIMLGAGRCQWRPLHLCRTLMLRHSPACLAHTPFLPHGMMFPDASGGEERQHNQTTDPDTMRCMLCDVTPPLLQGILYPGWADSQHNLWQHTWHVAHKLSSNLTPQMLNPAANPSRLSQQPQQQQQPQQLLQGLATLPQGVGISGQQLPQQLMQQQQQQGQPVVEAGGVVLGVDRQVQQLPQVPEQTAH